MGLIGTSSTSLSQDNSWQFDKQGQFYHAVESDSQFLYLKARVPEGQLQNQILLTGWTVWLQPGGKKQQQKGILYPVGIPSAQVPRDPGLFQELLNGLDQATRKKLLSEEEMLLIGFYTGDKNDVVRAPLRNPSGFEVNGKLQTNGELFYQAQIPLEALSAKTKYRWAWETGGLGRPEMTGNDAVGISGGSISNPKRYETQSERSRQRLLETYRLYASPSKWRSRKIKVGE
jgi:hypothetical protein